MSSNFGIDLIFETQRGNIKSENDVLIILVHWMMCKNEFRNVGIGDNVCFCVLLKFIPNLSCFTESIQR